MTKTYKSIPEDDRYKSTPEDDRLLFDDKADPVERAEAMHTIGIDELYDFEPKFAELLHHEESAIRAQAVDTLVGYWSRDAYLNQAYEMLRSDTSTFVRHEAAGGLGSWLRNAGTRHPRYHEVVCVLVAVLSNEKHEPIQRTLYSDIFESLGDEHPELPVSFDLKRDVDWERLKPFLPDNQ